MYFHPLLHLILSLSPNPPPLVSSLMRPERTLDSKRFADSGGVNSFLARIIALF
jgi:hypothetical protein